MTFLLLSSLTRFCLLPFCSKLKKGKCKKCWTSADPLIFFEQKTKNTYMRQISFLELAEPKSNLLTTSIDSAVQTWEWRRKGRWSRRLLARWAAWRSSPGPWAWGGRRWTWWCRSDRRWTPESTPRPPQGTKRCCQSTLYPTGKEKRRKKRQMYFLIGLGCSFSSIFLLHFR